jgi:hypothetical protein
MEKEGNGGAIVASERVIDVASAVVFWRVTSTVQRGLGLQLLSAPASRKVATLRLQLLRARRTVTARSACSVFRRTDQMISPVCASNRISSALVLATLSSCWGMSISSCAERGRREARWLIKGIATTMISSLRTAIDRGRALWAEGRLSIRRQQFPIFKSRRISGAEPLNRRKPPCGGFDVLHEWTEFRNQHCKWRRSPQAEVDPDDASLAVTKVMRMERAIRDARRSRCAYAHCEPE